MTFSLLGSLSVTVIMATAGAKTTIKPFKLKPSSGDSITRDDLATWREVLLSHMRQNEKWKDFLPGGAKKEWKALDGGEENDWDATVKADFHSGSNQGIWDRRSRLILF